MRLPGTGAIDGFAIGPDGNILAAGSGRALRIWNTRDPHHPRRIGGELLLPSTVGGVAISPDKQTLAVGGDDGFTRLFNLTNPSRPTMLAAPLPSTPDDLVAAVAFSPDGQVLATAGYDREIRLWDTTDPDRPRLIGGALRGPSDQIFRLAFSPDGKRLASVGANHTTRIWNISDPARPYETKPLLKHTGTVGGVSWNADGTTLATGSSDRTVALWDMTNPAGGRAVGEPITGHTDNIYATAFGPVGVLASGGRDRVVRLWHLDVDWAIGRVCETAPDTLTRQAWNTYVSPDRSYEPPCAAFADSDQRSSAWR